MSGAEPYALSGRGLVPAERPLAAPRAAWLPAAARAGVATLVARAVQPDLPMQPWTPPGLPAEVQDPSQPANASPSLLEPVLPMPSHVDAPAAEVTLAPAAGGAATGVDRGAASPADSTPDWRAAPARPAAQADGLAPRIDAALRRAERDLAPPAQPVIAAPADPAAPAPPQLRPQEVLAPQASPPLAWSRPAAARLAEGPAGDELPAVHPSRQPVPAAPTPTALHPAALAGMRVAPAPVVAALAPAVKAPAAMPAATPRTALAVPPAPPAEPSLLPKPVLARAEPSPAASAPVQIDLSALLSPTAAPGRTVHIAHLEVVAAAPPALPPAPQPTRTLTAPAARASAAAAPRAFRNPWAGYHSRRD